MYLHSIVLVLHVSPGAHLSWVPWGSFITWEGSRWLLSPNASFIIRTDRLSGCDEMWLPPVGRLSSWQKVLQTAEQAGTSGPAETLPTPTALPGCCLGTSRRCSPQDGGSGQELKLQNLWQRRHLKMWGMGRGIRSSSDWQDLKKKEKAII